MDLRQLKNFITIVEEGNISAAAKKLHISQPPLSLPLKLLEEEVGIKLIVRGARKCTLTDAGRIFYNRAVNISTLSDSAIMELGEFKEGRKGTLRLGIESAALSFLFSRRMVRFEKDNPDIRFDVYEGSTYELIEMIESGIIEAAVVKTPFSTDGLDAMLLDLDRMTVSAVRGLLKIKDRSIGSVDQIGDIPVGICRRYEAAFLSCCSEKDYMPNIVFKSDDPRTVLRWAGEGIGAAVVPESTVLASDAVELERTVLDIPVLASQTAIVSRKNAFLSWTVRSFIDAFSRS